MNEKSEKAPEAHLVTVYTVNDPVTAELIKNQLEEEGISCEIGGEHQGGFTGTLAVDIIVRESDVDRAKEIIDEHHV